MLGRALRLATVTLLTGCLTAVAVHALENLEAGKTPAQIFSGTCNACHKSPRGLLKSVPASSLPGFLRQHYTTSSDMASVLASYLVANGATDTRQQAKEGKDGKQGKDGAKDGTKEASRTPAEGAKRPPRGGETADPMRPDLMRPEPPPQAALDKGKKDKGKKGRPEETARTEPSAEPPKEAARSGEGTKPPAEPKVESAKVEPAKDAASEPATTRPDPVPAVTPAPTTSAAAPATSGASGASSVPPVQPLDGPSVPIAEPLKSIIELPKPPAVAAGPALPPVPPAGPPMVPISQ